MIRVLVSGFRARNITPPNRAIVFAPFQQACNVFETLAGESCRQRVLLGHQNQFYRDQEDASLEEQFVGKSF